MAIESRSKINVGFSMSSMTDIVFLLLIFFMITSTLIHPTALKLLLPRGSSQTSAKPLVTVSIDENFEYQVGDQRVSFSQIEPLLRQRLGNEPDTYISLHAHRDVPLQKVVDIMNIAKRNNYKLILATQPD